MKLLSHGPEPCASANSAIPAEQYLYYGKVQRKASIFFRKSEKVFRTVFVQPDRCGICWIWQGFRTDRWQSD